MTLSTSLRAGGPGGLAGGETHYQRATRARSRRLKEIAGRCSDRKSDCPGPARPEGALAVGLCATCALYAPKGPWNLRNPKRGVLKGDALRERIRRAYDLLGMPIPEDLQGPGPTLCQVIEEASQ